MYFAILTAALALCWLRSREGCCVSRDIVFSLFAAVFVDEVEMARNEEKQQGRLNRLWLQKEREGKRVIRLVRYAFS